MFHTIEEAVLQDGTRVALQRIDTTEYGGTVDYTVQLGLSGRHVRHAVHGYLVPCTTDGCVWCAGYEEKALECFRLVSACRTVAEAGRVWHEWWNTHICPLVN